MYASIAENILRLASPETKVRGVTLVTARLNDSEYDHRIPAYLENSFQELGYPSRLIFEDELYFDQEISNDKNDNQTTILLIFLSKAGDYLRDKSLASRAVTLFAPDIELLTAPFCTRTQTFLIRKRNDIDREISSCGNLTITCALGTNLSSLVNDVVHDLKVSDMQQFPIMTCSAFSGSSLNGTIAATKCIASAGFATRTEFSFEFEGPLTIDVINGRIASFDIPRHRTEEFKKFLKLYDIVDMGRGAFINSWHFGINPDCVDYSTGSRSLDKWVNFSFGRPNVLHFHFGGHGPIGALCIHIEDFQIVGDIDRTNRRVLASQSL